MKHFLIISLLLLLSLGTYSQNGKIKGTNVNFRSDTLIVTDNIIEQLSYLNTVSIIEKGVAWTKIKHLDRVGYVYSQFVSETFSISSLINKISLIQKIFIIIVLSSFIVPRFLMSLIVLIENKVDYNYVDRKFTEKLGSFLHETKVEKFFINLVGNNFIEISSWLIRIGSLIIIPIILGLVKLVIDYFILEQTSLNFELLYFSAYYLILAFIVILILMFIFSFLAYEIFHSISKIEFFRIPLMLILLIYSIPLAFIGLVYFIIIFSIYLIEKILIFLYKTIKFLQPIFLFFLNMILIVFRVGARRERYYE